MHVFVGAAAAWGKSIDRSVFVSVADDIYIMQIYLYRMQIGI